MTKTLNIGEMLELAVESGHPRAGKFIQSIEDQTTAMALDLAQHLDVKASPNGFEGIVYDVTCAEFLPKYCGQPCPRALQKFDENDLW